MTDVPNLTEAAEGLIELLASTATAKCSKGAREG